MFAFVKDGPEIPQEIFHALEEDRLVIFCGAGISLYTGLPDFKKLVNRLLNLLAAGNKREVAKMAFQQRQYDRALDVIEKNTLPNVMRKQLIQELSKRFSMPLDIHQAILDLAQSQRGNGYRLVTTNVDRRFLETERPLVENNIHVAPRLAPPRPGEWWSPVFLHGLIGPSDPDGKHLVFTSTDFGKAYLRDGWAARFVLELFREFTVLFIGYSVNDPAMAYLVDAMSAEVATGRFKQAYALDGYTGGQPGKNVAEQKWEAKGIRLIPFEIPQGRNKFARLHATLKEWAKFKKRGSSGRVAWALTLAGKPYTPGGEQADQEARHLRWLLSQSDGGVVRAFADKDPPPDISWLSVLAQPFKPGLPGWDEEASLVQFPSKDKDNTTGQFQRGGVLASNRHNPDLMRPLSPVTSHICQWLCHHLDKVELVDWVVEQGGTLHDFFARMVDNKLETDKKLEKCNVPDPFRRFWELMQIESQTPTGWLSPRVITQIGRLLKKKILNTVDRTIFLRSLAPRYQLDPQSNYWKRYKEITGTDHNIKSLADLVEIKIVLTNSRLIDIQLKSNQEEPFLTEFLDPLTSLLANAVQMGVDAEYADLANGRSCAVWRSIEPHSQNCLSHRNSWSVLGELCRRSFEKACDSDMEMARITVERWISFGQIKGFSLFRRLALHAFAHCHKLPADQAIPLLVQDKTLWDIEYRREVCRFLVHRGSHLSDDALAQLIREISNGEPRTLYSVDLDEEKFQRYSRSETDIRLAKLLQGGANLDAESRRRAEAYQNSLPDEEKKDDRDEFLYWVGKPFRIPEPTADDWMELSPQEIVDHLTQLVNSNSLEPFRQPDPREKLADLLKRDWKKGFRVVDLWLDQGGEIGEAWSTGLQRLRIVKKDAVSLISDLLKLIDSHPPLLQAPLYGLASAVKSVSKTLNDAPEPAEYWDLWDTVWKQSLMTGTSGIITEVHGLTWAINHPGGDLSEALLARLDQRKQKTGLGLPEDLKSRFDEISKGETETHHAGRIVLASQLVWLHALDPAWTKDHLIHRMTWQDGAPTDAVEDGTLTDAMAMWEGYLWSPSINVNLLPDLKPAMFTAFPRITPSTSEKLDKLCALFAEVLIEHPSGFSEKEIRSAFGSMTPKGLVGCAKYFKKKLQNAGDNTETLWQYSIEPLIQKCWPVDIPHRTDATSAALANMLLETREKFNECLNVLRDKNLLVPFDGHHLFSIIDNLAQSLSSDSETPRNVSFNLVLSFPKETLSLLDTVIPPSPQQDWPLHGLGDILRQIISSQPELENSPAYRRLDHLRIMAHD